MNNSKQYSLNFWRRLFFLPAISMLFALPSCGGDSLSSLKKPAPDSAWTSQAAKISDKALPDVGMSEDDAMTEQDASRAYVTHTLFYFDPETGLRTTIEERHAKGSLIFNKILSNSYDPSIVMAVAHEGYLDDTLPGVLPKALCLLSRDAGKTWTVTSISVKVCDSVKQIMPTAQGDIYITDGQSILRSEDKGDTWPTVPTSFVRYPHVDSLGSFDDHIFVSLSSETYQSLAKFDARGSGRWILSRNFSIVQKKWSGFNGFITIGNDFYATSFTRIYKRNVGGTWHLLGGKRDGVFSLILNATPLASKDSSLLILAKKKGEARFGLYTYMTKEKAWQALPMPTKYATALLGDETHGFYLIATCTPNALKENGNQVTEGLPGPTRVFHSTDGLLWKKLPVTGITHPQIIADSEGHNFMLATRDVVQSYAKGMAHFVLTQQPGLYRYDLDALKVAEIEGAPSADACSW